ncbi:MAG TPA: family 16 glycoside hydrolase [Anaerolineales bacterium]|nr:family 16 glycoside hydrolase [Anaerolineales bacterium]
MKPLRPLFFFSALILLVGLACSALGGATDPTQAPPPTEPVQVIPTEPPPQPTEAPPTESAPTLDLPAPTEPPAPEPQVQQFFTEEFDNPLTADWDILTVTGSADADPDKVTVEADDGKLIWDFDSEYLYYYLFYNAFDYDDVRLDVRADNRGRNNNSISLICRYNPDEGWYEFNIANSGVYDILYGEIKSNGDIAYSTIANGGSLAIKQGMEVNEYAITCEDNELTLIINGDEVTSIAENRYGLRSGQVGVSVSSFNVLPILIEMDWIEISEP